MELGDPDVKVNNSECDENAIEKHCKKMADLKEKVFNSAEENIKCAQLRYKRDYDRKHAGKRKVRIHIHH